MIRLLCHFTLVLAAKMKRKTLGRLLKICVVLIVIQVTMTLTGMFCAQDSSFPTISQTKSNIFPRTPCDFFSSLCTAAKTENTVKSVLEENIFSENIQIKNNTGCQTPRIEAPPNLCKPVKFHCNQSATFVEHDRQNRKLNVSCQGKFKVNFITREERQMPYKRNAYSKSEEWVEFEGPGVIDFPSDYADVVCPIQTKLQHNYRTQYFPDEDRLQLQKVIFGKTVSREPDWVPLAIISLCFDSLSRAQFHRSCGMPKTKRFLQNLIHPGAGDKYRAYVFTHLNAVSGNTAMNLTPLYAGKYFSPEDERKRVEKLKLAMGGHEWTWDYANKRGYITSVGGDTGNGLFGTRHLCDSCTIRPGVLPHWEHGWVKLENQKIAPGVLSGFCDGDTMAFEHLLNFTSDLMNESHPAIWTSLAIKVQHREEQESILQVDDFFENWLRELLVNRDDIVLHIFGDHGNIYHGEHMAHIGGHFEVLNPFSALILPRKHFDSHPEWLSNLQQNQDKYVTHYDFHTTMKSLLHFPKLEQVSGHLWNQSSNLLTSVISEDRGCTDAGIPEYGCLCSDQRAIPETEYTSRTFQSMIQAALRFINMYHSSSLLRRADLRGKNATTCVDITFRKFMNIIEVSRGDSKTKVPHKLYHLFFESPEGPSKWHAVVEAKGKVIIVKQMSRYAKYEFCKDYRVSIEYCICHQFPEGTP